MIASRIVYSEEFGKYVDEVLETVYFNIHHALLDPNEMVSIGPILDDYARSMLGEAFVPFGNAGIDRLHASAWTQQFGELLVSPQENGEFHAWLVGADYYAIGQSELDAVLLAGIDAIRKVSNAILSTSETRH